MCIVGLIVMQDYQALVSQVQDYHQQIQEGAG